jgi:CHAT domain-containing protein
LLAPARQERRLLAVINPTGDLPFTPLEGEAILDLFAPENRQALGAETATVEAVKQAVVGQGYLHFSCHGFYNWRDTLQSGLLLAQQAPLTLAQIIGELDLSAARLVVLSACETGLTDIRHSPDEFLGLPAGFLQAGAPAVISSLWAVNDLSTALLMAEFYRLHLKEEIPLAEALRQAQRWLRALRPETIPSGFQAEWQRLQERGLYWGEWGGTEPEFPFAHPYYWAAFTFSGV